jgi:hypothetical protein
MINTTKQFMTEATIAMKLTSYPILLWVLNYTQIDKEAGAILAILLVLDVLTALSRVALINPKSFSSRVGIVGILSKCLTFTIPFILAVVGKGAGLDMGTFVNYSLRILVIYEGWSILGNIGQIRAKDTSLNEYDAISLMIRKIQGMFKTLLDQVYKSGSDKPLAPKEVTEEANPVKVPTELQD